MSEDDNGVNKWRLSETVSIENQPFAGDSCGQVNQATLHLQEACESGEQATVEKLLRNGRVQINALVVGHRANRTALHRAASYGHTNVVKLLLKHGADADRLSSVQRTALHEACMGGHHNTLKELVQYAENLDICDNNGQTALHVAAYHGETECVQILVNHGGNINCSDNHQCSPAHLAVVKNHPETIRSLLDSKIDIVKGDGQGRTAVHHAALHGSVNCLKVFQQCRVDLTVVDHGGATALHHAASGGHLEGMQFLNKAGLALQARDNTGRTCAHYAAQKGSTECLHWILENAVGANITDDCGNTLAHSAAVGHMQAMNCLLAHNADMTLTNSNGDTPDMLSRKHGHTQAFQKAMNDEIRCPYCIMKAKQIAYDLKHETPQVVKNMKKVEQVIFKSPIKARSPKCGDQKPKRKIPEVTQRLSKRELSTQFYGEHVFAMTDIARHLPPKQ